MNAKIDNTDNDLHEDTSVRKTLVRSKNRQTANYGSFNEAAQVDFKPANPDDPRVMRELDPDNLFKLGKFRI